MLMINMENELVQDAVGMSSIDYQRHRDQVGIYLYEWYFHFLLQRMCTDSLNSINTVLIYRTVQMGISIEELS